MYNIYWEIEFVLCHHYARYHHRVQWHLVTNTKPLNKPLTIGIVPSNLPDGHPAWRTWQHMEYSFKDQWPSLHGWTPYLRTPHGWKSIISLLHKSHCGQVKTSSTARDHYFWPAMKNDLKTIINKCEVCQSSCPSLQIYTFIRVTSEEPMTQVLVNPFQVGKSHYLLLVDRFSGYLMVTRLKSSTSETMLQQLKHWFNKFGYLWVPQYDVSLQFHSQFATFCSGQWDLKWGFIAL